MQRNSLDISYNIFPNWSRPHSENNDVPPPPPPQPPACTRGSYCTYPGLVKEALVVLHLALPSAAARTGHTERYLLTDVTLTVTLQTRPAQRDYKHRGE